MWLTELKFCALHRTVFNRSLKKWPAASGGARFSQFSERESFGQSDQPIDKLIYHSFTTPNHYLEVFKRKRLQSRYDKNNTSSDRPISLKLLGNNNADPKRTSRRRERTINQSLNKFTKSNLPYQYCVDYGVKDIIENVQSHSDHLQESRVRTGVSVEAMMADESIKGGKTWMNDYEQYCSDKEVTSDHQEWLVNYGTADPDVPVSNVACGGCGAYLHCKEPSLPGYLPSEIFLECRSRELQALLCQRCHFLKNYNTALSVQVDPSKYEELISRIKPKALVVLVVDLTDVAGSLWPNITEVLGKRRPVFLVGNKVDLLWGDRKGWLKHIETILKQSLPAETNILNTCLISAKTGFGVEDLVSKLQMAWKGSDDVYIVGCTNVGKSTLFNTLIQSDYCKTKAVDLVQRATTAPWPGTTLNLLKFPILRPSAWRLAVRNIRLQMELSREKAETQLRTLQKQAKKKRIITPPQLIGNISHSFKGLSADEDNPDLFTLPKRVANSQVENHKISLVNNKEPSFEGRWCYDTPGVLHKDQILNLLTADELLLTIPRETIVPRTYLLYEGMSLFIACLARLDYIKGDKGARVTVFASNKLPVSICLSEDAEHIYNRLLGSKLSVVPQGSESRLKEWPGLSSSEPMSLCGVDKDESCADITFSTTGWISIAPERNQICKLVAWSPLKRGISVRYPPLLPFAVRVRGKKIPSSPAYTQCRLNKAPNV